MGSLLSGGKNCLNTLMLENVGSALLRTGVHCSLVTHGFVPGPGSTEAGQIKVQK